MNLVSLLRLRGRHQLRHLLTHEEYMDYLRLWNCAPWSGDRDDMRAVFLAGASVAPYTKRGRMPNVSDYLYVYGAGKPRTPRSETELKEVIRNAPGNWIHTDPAMRKPRKGQSDE